MIDIFALLSTRLRNNLLFFSINNTTNRKQDCIHFFHNAHVQLQPLWRLKCKVVNARRCGGKFGNDKM